MTGLELPVWSPRKELRCNAAEALRAAAVERQRGELNRLLYVALTRAEDRLVVCGCEPMRGGCPEECWYESVRQGFARAGAIRAEPLPVGRDPWDGRGAGSIRSNRRASAPVADRAGDDAHVEAAWTLPGWVGERSAVDDPLPPPIEPTVAAAAWRPASPEQADFGLGRMPRASLAAAQSRDARGQGGSSGGNWCIPCCNTCPTLPEAGREAAARRYLGQRRPQAWVTSAADSLARDIMARAAAIPGLVPVFAAGQPRRGASWPAWWPTSWSWAAWWTGWWCWMTACWWWTTRPTASRPQPWAPCRRLYLRQMAAYRAVLRGAFPWPRRVVCALIWTTGADRHGAAVDASVGPPCAGRAPRQPGRRLDPFARVSPTLAIRIRKDFGHERQHQGR